MENGVERLVTLRDYYCEPTYSSLRLCLFVTDKLSTNFSFVCVCVCMYIYICIYTHTHTHTHTYTCTGDTVNVYRYFRINLSILFILCLFVPFNWQQNARYKWRSVCTRAASDIPIRLVSGRAFASASADATNGTGWWLLQFQPFKNYISYDMSKIAYSSNCHSLTKSLYFTKLYKSTFAI